MKIFRNLFIVRRPVKSVLEQSNDYEKGKLSTMTEIYMDKKMCIKYGFQDGYVKCLEDLGINHTVNGHCKQP